MPDVTSKLTRPIPKRELRAGDMILIKQYNHEEGPSKKPHYFLVMDTNPNQIEDRETGEKYSYNLTCLHTGSVDPDNPAFMAKRFNIMHNSNIYVENKNMVWYSNAKMPASHKEEDSLVTLNHEYLFDSDSLDYQHCGEMLAYDTFDEDYLNRKLRPDELAQFENEIESADTLFVRSIMKRNTGFKTEQAELDKDKDTRYRVYTPVYKNLPDYKAAKAKDRAIRKEIMRDTKQSKPVSTFINQSKKPKRTLTPEQETSVLLMKEHVDNEDKPKPSSAATNYNPYNE